MNRILGFMLGAAAILGGGEAVRAQGVVYWPPASGHMEIVPPVYAGPGAVGGQYLETFPTFNGGYQPNAPSTTQSYVPYGTQTRPAQAAKARGRAARGTRVYSRGYNQAPAPYATQLPRGQLVWPGSALAPGYTPASRYQSYGNGYGVSPYGSNFWGGYYKGFPMIGD